MSKLLNQVSEEAWEARDLVENLSVGMQQMAQFLNKFGMAMVTEGGRRQGGRLLNI